jgi:hypothetical protein
MLTTTLDDLKLPQTLDVKFESLDACIRQYLVLENDVYTFRRGPGRGNIRNVRVRSLPLFIDGKPLVVEPFFLFLTMTPRSAAEDPFPTVFLDPLAWIPMETVSNILGHYPGAVGLALLTNEAGLIFPWVRRYPHQWQGR